MLYPVVYVFLMSLDQTDKLGLYRFVGRWSSQWELLSTAAFLAIIPVLVLFYLIEGRLVKGLAGGAVKE